MSEQESRPFHEKSQLDFMSEEEGFWLAASAVSLEPADQTFESLCERSRFYGCRLPEELRARLAVLNRSGPGRESEFVEALAKAYEEVIPRHAHVKGIARRRARIEAEGGLRSNSSEIGGLSFIHHPSPKRAHWGGLQLIFYGTLGLATGHDRFSKASPASNALARLIGAQICESILDRMEVRWSLPPATALSFRDDSRYHWAEDWPPSCMDPEGEARAAQAMEALRLSRELSALAGPGRSIHPCAAPRSL